MFKKNYKESCLLYFRDFAQYNPYFIDRNIIPGIGIEFIIYTKDPKNVYREILSDLNLNFIPSKTKISRHKNYIIYYISFTDEYFTNENVTIYITDGEKPLNNNLLNKKDFLNI